MTKADVMDVISAYQEHVNRFINVDQQDLDKIYLETAKRGAKRIFKS